MNSMTMRIKKRVGVAVGLTAVFALGACGAPASQTGGGATAAPGDAGGASMLVAMDNGSPQFERNFNPFSGSKRNTATIVYEPLFVLNTLDGELVPFLATGFEQPDASTIVVTLRDGATWTDGEAFTVDDVLFTFQMLKDFPALDTMGIWQNIESVEGEGSTFTIHLNKENAWATNIVLPTTIVPEHLWSGVADPVTFKNEEPVGSGPYALGDFAPNQYKLVKNETYWNADAVAATELVLPAANEQLDLVSKPYDWAYAFISDVENTWVAAAEGNIYWFPPGGTIALYPNLTMAPFDNADFRLGLSLALDRAKVADVAEEGYVDPAGGTGLLLPNQEVWLNPDIADQGAITQNAEEALTHFAAAGYTQEGGKLVDASGTQVALTITTPNGWTDWLRGVQEVQRQLEGIGIAVTLNQPQPAAYQASLQTGDFQLAMGSFGGSGSVYQDYNTLLGGEFNVPIGTITLANYQRFQDPAVDELLAQLKVTTDEAQQKDIVNQLQIVMVEQMPVIPLFYGGLWGLFNESRFTGWPSEADPYATTATWGNNPLLVLTNIKLVG